MWCELHNKLNKFTYWLTGDITWYRPVESVPVTDVIFDIFFIVFFPVYVVAFSFIGIIERIKLKLPDTLQNIIDFEFKCSKLYYKKDECGACKMFLYPVNESGHGECEDRATVHINARKCEFFVKRESFWDRHFATKNLWVLMCPIGAISGYFIGNELNTTLCGAIIGLTLGFIFFKDKS